MMDGRFWSFDASFPARCGMFHATIPPASAPPHLSGLPESAHRPSEARAYICFAAGKVRPLPVPACPRHLQHCGMLQTTNFTLPGPEEEGRLTLGFVRCRPRPAPATPPTNKRRLALFALHAVGSRECLNLDYCKARGYHTVALLTMHECL